MDLSLFKTLYRKNIKIQTRQQKNKFQNQQQEQGKEDGRKEKQGNTEINKPGYH